MSLFDDFLSYTGSNNKPDPKLSRQRNAALRPVKAAQTGPIMSQTVVLAEGALAVQSPQKQAPAPVAEKPARDIELVPYSDKSFAVFGDTKPIKDKLADLGGTFNRWLKRDGVPTPGYIFSNKRLDMVREALKF